MTRQCMTLFAMLAAALCTATGCTSDNPQYTGFDGGPEAPSMMEDTATRCQDGQDNDGDGKTDCADEDCAIFAHCGGSVDGPAAGDSAVDAQAPDGVIHDAPHATDGPKTDTALPPADGEPPADTGTPADGEPPADTLPVDSSHDVVPPDTGSPDHPPPDTGPPHDGGAADGPVCGNDVCEVGESCDGRGGTIPCLGDCPGVTTGQMEDRYCWIDGVCTGNCP